MTSSRSKACASRASRASCSTSPPRWRPRTSRSPATKPGSITARAPSTSRPASRYPRKPGIAKLRAALGADVTLSELERAFLRLLAAHGLPRPRTNVEVAGDKVDCHWPELGLTIELLSYRYHPTRHAFETDVARRRRSHHIAYTWGDVTERAARTAAEVAQLLQRRAA